MKDFDVEPQVLGAPLRGQFPANVKGTPVSILSDVPADSHESHWFLERISFLLPTSNWNEPRPFIELRKPAAAAGMLCRPVGEVEAINDSIELVPCSWGDVPSGQITPDFYIGEAFRYGAFKVYGMGRFHASYYHFDVRRFPRSVRLVMQARQLGSLLDGLILQYGFELQPPKSRKLGAEEAIFRAAARMIAKPPTDNLMLMYRLARLLGILERERERHGDSIDAAGLERGGTDRG